MNIDIKKILFENLGIRQTILKNTFWLTVTEGIVQVLKLFLIVYMARLLGAEEYGKFSFALSFVGLFVIFAELGLPDIVTREFSKDKSVEQDYSSVISLKIFLSVAVFLLMIIGSFFITQDIIIRKSIWLLSIFILITSFLNIFYAFFRARQKMEYESLFKILQYALLCGLSFFVLFTIPSIENISIAYLISNITIAAAMLIFFHFFIQPMSISYNKEVWKKFIHFSWPLALGLVIGWIYVSASSVMLGYFGYNMENGWYNAAYKIIGAVAISATLISKSFFPVLSKFSLESKERIQKVWNYQKELMIIFAFPMMIGSIVLAPKIIYFFYDSSFTPSIFAFRWLVIVSGIDFLYYPYALALIIFNKEKRNFVFIIIGLLLNIVLNIILIPQYNIYGVAVANVISSIVVLALAVYAMVRYTPLSPFNAHIRNIFVCVAFSGAIMFLAISMPIFYNLNLVVVISLGIGVYFLTLTTCFKALKIHRWKMIT